MEYILHIAVIASIYVTLTVSLDMLAGHTGLLSVAHAAFYGLGAYASALVAMTGATFLFCTGIAMIVAALVSLAVSIPGARTQDDGFVIVTFAFQMVVFSVFNNWMAVTGGPLGITGIPRPSIFGWTIVTLPEYVLLSAFVACGAYLAVNRVVTSPLGRVLRALREDESFAQALGKNPFWFKVTIVAASASLAGAAGSLYAHFSTYIDPTSFTVLESVLILAMVIVGGASSRWGPLIGALVLVLLPEALRFAGIPTAAAANLRQLLYGALLVIMMLVRPQGLAGHYSFRQ